MAVRVAGCTASADPQHDLAQDVAGLHAFLRLCSFRQRELRCDGHLELHRLDGTVEALELLRPWDRVVADDRDAIARLWFGLDSVGKRHVPPGSQGVNATLECVSACERQHGIYPCGGELMGGACNVAVAAVNDGIGAQPLHEGESVLAGSGGEDFDAAQLRELQRETPNTPGSTVNDECLAGLQMQGGVGSLDRREPGGRNGSG